MSSSAPAGTARVPAGTFALCLGALLCLASLSACADGREVTQPYDKTRARIVALDMGGIRVEAAVVDTYAARRQGLSGVASLGAAQGMLFVYPELARRRFWMKDCLISLDIAFLDAAGRVVWLETLAPPSPESAVIPETRRSPPCAYVLETRAGFFEQHGLGVGTRVVIPDSVQRSAAE